MPRSKPKHVVIIGAGLFGSIAAKICSDAGFVVTVIDNNEKASGSKPAACLMKPSWMSGLGSKMDKGLEVLDSLYGVKELQFTVNSLKKATVLWVPPSRILWKKVVRKRVLAVGDGWVEVEGARYNGYVLVAAGVWSSSLVETPEISSLVGSALIYNGKHDPEIHIYAPYRQAVLFNRTPSKVWFGDGTSILKKNYSTKHDNNSIQRAAKYGLRDHTQQIIGQRPYIKGEKGYFAQVHQNTWVSTGGAKNGTVLAAYQARLFLEAIS